MFTDNLKDNLDITRQQRYVCSMGNSVIKDIKHCTDKKIQPFETFCFNFYCCQLWSTYKCGTYNKLCVAHNNVLNFLLRLSSISTFMVNFKVDSFYVLLESNCMVLEREFETLAIY